MERVCSFQFIFQVATTGSRAFVYRIRTLQLTPTKLKNLAMSAHLRDQLFQGITACLVNLVGSDQHSHHSGNDAVAL